MPDTAERPRLFLIDGYSNIFRAFYAIRNLSSSKGEPTNAVFGFVQMLRKLLRDERPHLVGVALDVGGPTVRSELYADYKAHRKPMPEDLRPQIPWIRRALTAYRIPILELARYEADDVLGSLAAKAEAAGYDVVLVSADKDLMQLVTPHVSLYHTGRDKLYDPALVAEDFGVPPERVRDVLALMGDASDNVPGVPGIGQKGAQKLIQDFGSLEELLERAEEVRRKSYREGLQQNAEQARRSYELVTIHTGLEVPFEPDQLRHDEPDSQALRELFTELEFYSLADELGPEEKPELPAAREAETADAWRAAVEGLGAGTVHADLLPAAGRAVGLVVGDGPAAPWFVDFRREGLETAAREAVTAWLADDRRRLVGHDLKELLRWSGAYRRVKAELVDLMLLSYLLKPAVHGHSLEELALERLGRKIATAKEVGWDKGGEPAAGDPRLEVWAGERLAVLARMAPGMGDELGDGALAAVYAEMEAPLMPVLVAMEELGIRLDVPFLEAMSEELGGELQELEREIYDIAGEEFNINSPQQLGQILFEKLGYPVLKKTRKTKSYATGAEVLEQLATRGYPLPERLLRYRELSKLKSTYVDALPALVAADGRLHTRFNQAVAATGRLSSSDPNLQNIPVRTEMGQRIRRAFVAAPGHVLLVADYSQIELRVLAHIAGEEALVEAFRQGQDIHRTTAAAVLGVAPELVNAEQRRAAKTINFGILYGMSAFGLSQNLHIPPKEAERFIATYLAQYPQVKAYMDSTLEQAQAEGKVETLYGRVRYLPDIHSKNWNLRENARRMAINARIQGTAADLMKMAILAVDLRLRRDAPESHLLLTVHDELVLEVPAADAPRVAELVKAEMETVATLAVPLEVDAAWGESWYAAKG